MQSASHAGPCTRVITSVEKKGFEFFDIEAVVSEEGGAAHTINLYKERRVQQGEAEVAGAKWRALLK